MIVSANMATIQARENYLYKVVDSLIDQVDVIRIWANDYNPVFEDAKVEVYGGEDLTDNGKFAFLKATDKEYYFTVDDDMLYPDNYVENTIYYLNKYPNHVITYHGRKLQGKGLNYYKGHTQYHCLRTVDGNWDIDVPGTGVTAFNTDLVRFDVRNWDKTMMSDLMLALELAKRDIPIMCVQHKIWWINSLLKANDNSIYKDYVNDCQEQSEIADEIWDINSRPLRK